MRYRHQCATGLLRLRQQFFVECFFGGFVERAGGFVGKNPLRFFQQHAGDGESLLLAAREFLAPGIAVIQPLSELRQQGVIQRLFQLGVAVTVHWLRIGQRVTQAAVREIRSLRNEHGAVRHHGAAVCKRPDAGQRAEQGRLAAARRPVQQHAVAGLGL